jgi:uncharacterized protein DUF3630
MELPLERLAIRPMASGNESLLLTERVGWESFPPYAEAILQLLEGAVVSRADGPDRRVWTVRIGTQLFWLTYEDFPIEVSLDPQNSEASALVPAICQQLLDHRERARG